MIVPNTFWLVRCRVKFLAAWSGGVAVMVLTTCEWYMIVLGCSSVERLCIIVVVQRSCYVAHTIAGL